MGEPTRQPLKVLPFAAGAVLFGVAVVSGWCPGAALFGVWPGCCPGAALFGVWLGVV